MGNFFFLSSPARFSDELKAEKATELSRNENENLSFGGVEEGFKGERAALNRIFINTSASEGEEFSGGRKRLVHEANFMQRANV